MVMIRMHVPNSPHRSLQNDPTSATGALDVEKYLVEQERDNQPQAGPCQEQGNFEYKQWNYRNRNYPKDWCMLRELDGLRRDTCFVEATVEKYVRPAPGKRKSCEACAARKDC